MDTEQDTIAQARMADKARQYDKIVRECQDRQGAAMRVLAGSSSGYRHAPVEAVLAAFDKLTKPR